MIITSLTSNTSLAATMSLPAAAAKPRFSKDIIEQDHFHCAYELTYLEDIRFTTIHLDVKKNIVLPFKIEDHEVMLYFSLKGNFSLQSENFKSLHINSGTHNIIYADAINGSYHFGPGSYELFCLTLPLDVFRTYFPKPDLLSEAFHSDLVPGCLVLLRKTPGVISLQLFKIIKEIRAFPTDSDFINIFLKGKVMELLSVQLEELCTICDFCAPIKKDITEKMYDAKAFISAHLADNYSIQDIAKEVGTNEHTLKHEFKKLFGNTVFGFWHEQKMEKAQNLLLENQKSISEISKMIGYKNPQHFSTAFKKRFGTSPSLYKNKLLSNK